MKAYIIYPDRDLTEAQRSRVTRYAEKLANEEGWEVHLPRSLSTLQSPAEVLNLMQERSEAIRQADQVFVFWDLKSSSCDFDIGTAFALEKQIELLRIFDGAEVVDNPIIGLQVMDQFTKLAKRHSVVPVIEVVPHKPSGHAPD